MLENPINKDLSAIRLADRLSIPVRLKTWSVIVTVFGDTILPRGGRIQAGDLNTIMEAMGISAGATRTALSRLAGEGMVLRQREGRNSVYQLARSRASEFRDAKKRIYATGVQRRPVSEFKLVSFGTPAVEQTLQTAKRVSREWLLVHEDSVDPVLHRDAVVVQPQFDSLPEWFVQRIAKPELADAMLAFADVFESLERALERDPTIEPLEALGLRILLIHSWRRIALRLPELPSDLVPADWPEEMVRALTGGLYVRLKSLSDPWLDEVVGKAKPAE